jgi:superfamily I DNA/RNA helicase
VITKDSWRPADGLTLEPNALKAATEDSRSLALTAGPGAGKTEMLAQRADFLLRSGLCRYPQRILAISFKVDASRNLKDRVRKRCGSDLASRFDSYTFDAFAKRIIDRFRPVLTGAQALNADYTIGPNRIQRKSITFKDLVPLADEILDKSSVALNAVRHTYSHVFLDEFQDCTDSQYKLIIRAFRGATVPLTAVGDTKQRIMGWAGALEGIFVKFADDFDAVGLNLYQNFRSLPRLRRMQNRMVLALEPPAALDDADIEGDTGKINFRHFGDSYEEAVAIADSIQHWIDVESVAHSEIAILVPRQPELYCDLLMAELQGRAIPYRNEKDLQDLSTEPIARLIVDFLAVVFGDREPESYARLMSTLGLAFLDEDDRRHFEWRQFLDGNRNNRPELAGANIDGVKALVHSFLKRLGVDFLRALAAEYEQGPFLKAKVEETFARISDLWDGSRDIMQALSRFSEDRALRILTIHKSKGLEFDTVVILGVEAEAFWGELEDERAAFFVGISRAKRRLVLTSVDYRPTPISAGRHWKEQRNQQDEFLAYATGLESED